jgi:large conductance mechanosensitive channel
MTDAKGLLQEFKTFVLRGNVVDLAVAVVIGAAFGAVVSALVRDLVTPIVAAVFGQPDFSSLTFSINHSRFLYGDFLNAVFAFMTIAAAVFLFVVKPVNVLMARFAKEPDPEAPTKQCPECLTAIPLAARRCFACTASQPAAA